ncbi:hypothetical protein F4825DRAFT_430021 [Nemania diffusa]|nr:hypothetical protein F4825DRAFT_430021 [Nemania diffusa]
MSPALGCLLLLSRFRMDSYARLTPGRKKGVGTRDSRSPSANSEGISTHCLVTHGNSGIAVCHELSCAILYGPARPASWPENADADVWLFYISEHVIRGRRREAQSYSLFRGCQAIPNLIMLGRQRNFDFANT